MCGPGVPDDSGRPPGHASPSPGTDWKRLRLKAELDVKGQRHPITWPSRQALNADGSLTLAPTKGVA